VGRVAAQLFRTLHDGKIMEGRDGWYFLSNDTNGVVDQLCGRLLLSDADLRAWQRRLECRTAWLARLATPYVFVVAPNPHSLYPEKLPEGIVPSAERPVTQLIGQLARAGSFAHLVYPLDEILAARERRPVAAPNETHWNSFAAFVAYGSLLDELGDRVAARRLTEEQVVWVARRRIGDLGAKLDPPMEAEHLEGRILAPGARVVSDNRVQNRGRLVEIECAAAPGTTCLVMGDSFTYEMLPFLGESFRRTVYAQIPTFDYDLAESVAPDVVVALMNERFLRFRWPEFSAPTILELAGAKQRDGLVGVPPLDELFTSS